ncbi:SecY-interacting protein [Neptuniibacter halophilus]|uniref:SecY-interacting protein n=1 Tax=Neptuniibacter halophilus TaxID=651666 RepID=UPI002572BDEB|nr:SecY-interacting protein [Neptuniibacter halophilus]
MSAESVHQALEQFVSRLKQLQPEAPLIPYNSDWPSDCYLHTVSAGTPVGWRPALQTQPQDMFQRLSEALEEDVHPDLVAFYTHFWSDPLPAHCSDGDLSLLQVWNPEDMERLRSNLIGHALSKRQQKRPLTFFFACPEPDENFFISLDNFSGEVWLEAPGKPPLRKLADNLSDFLNTLQPRPIMDME